MDDFRVNGRIMPLFVEHAGKKVRNYEDPRMWDENALAHKLRACADTGFVCEGNHLLRYPSIAALADTERYYIDIPFEVSLARRKTRNRGTAPDWSFALIGKMMTKVIVEPQKDWPRVRVIDGQLTTDEIVAGIVTPAEAFARR